VVLDACAPENTHASVPCKLCSIQIAMGTFWTVCGGPQEGHAEYAVQNALWNSWTTQG
jgi:hypothetical protein